MKQAPTKPIDPLQPEERKPGTSLAEIAKKHLSKSQGLQLGTPLNLDKTTNTVASRLVEIAYGRNNLNPTSVLDRTARPVAIPATIKIKDPIQLGLLIKASRNGKKITQQQLADLAGVGRRFIVECEAGKPRLEFAKVLQVAAAAGIDIFAVKR